MSGEVVDFGFVSKEEAQVKRYKKPLKDAAMKEKKEREAMEKWNKELAEMEERKPMAEGVEPVGEVEVPELGVVPVAAMKAEEECAPVVPAGVKTVAQLKEEVAGDGVLKELKAAPVEEVVGKVKKTNGALPWERKGDRGSAKVVAKALGASWGTIMMRGLGILPFLASSSTMACSPGASAGDSSRALYMDSTILSENQ